LLRWQRGVLASCANQLGLPAAVESLQRRLVNGRNITRSFMAAQANTLNIFGVYMLWIVATLRAAA
jgi:hypothetical protein